jgi:uncharacterized protein (TIGR00255 family)
MTAYGRGQAPTAQGGSWLVELRSVNSRFLDPYLRLPPGIMGLEDRVKKYLGQRLTRGRINLTATSSGVTMAPPRLMLNRALVHEYRRVLEELKAELGLDSDPGLGPFITNRDLVLAEDAAPDLDDLWRELEPALAASLDEAETMRAAEGAALAQDMLERLERLEQLFKEVESRSPELVEAYRQRLQERIAKLMEVPQPDPQRLALEVAIMADRCDIAEEAVRAMSHIKQFRIFLQAAEPVGRKLDFLIQELNREANTMGSKSPDAGMAQLIVEIKSELERVREQVQNVE